MVTDEMVEKAANAIAKKRGYVWPGTFDAEEIKIGRENMRAALEAALSAAEPVATYRCDERAFVERWWVEPGNGFDKLSDGTPLYASPPASSVAVKALEWKEDGKYLLARMGDREYSLNITSDGETWAGCTRPYVFGHNLTWSSVPNCSMVSLDAAKAAAQAYYEARILSALSAQVQDVAELDEKTIVRLAWENFSEKDYGRLTYERAPPMFPQAKYDVPTYALSQFVKAIRAAAPTKQEG